MHPQDELPKCRALKLSSEELDRPNLALFKPSRFLTSTVDISNDPAAQCLGPVKLSNILSLKLMTSSPTRVATCIEE